MSAFLTEAQERGRVETPELEALALELDLDEPAIDDVRAALADRAIAIDANDDTDETDAVAAAAEEAVWTADTSQVLTDSLQLFLQDVGKHKLLTAADEVALAKRVGARRQGGQGEDDQRQPPPRRLDRRRSTAVTACRSSI